MFPTGALVWAKQGRFPAWPAIVSPNSSGKTEKKKDKKSHTHVVYLDYDEQHAWVPTKNVKEFTGESNDKRNVKSVETAVATAISMMEMNVDDRLTLLGTGRPVIRATDMQHEEGRNDGEDENNVDVAFNNNGREKGREEKGAHKMLEEATNMQNEVGRKEADDKIAQVERSTDMLGGTNDKNTQPEMDTNDNHDTEAVAVNNGRKRARVQSTNKQGGTTNKNMQPEMDTYEKDDISGHGRNKARVGRSVPMPGGSTNTNSRQKNPPQAKTSKNGNQICSCPSKRVKLSFEMEESTWLKTIEIAPKFLETVSKLS